MTPHDVETTLAEIADRLESGQSVVAKAHTEMLEATREHEWAMAHALLRAEGPNAEARKAVATLAVRDERIVMDVAVQKYAYAKGQLDALKSKADLYRSIGSSIKASMILA